MPIRFGMMSNNCLIEHKKIFQIRSMSINFRISILELYIFKLILASYEKKNVALFSSSS